MAGTNTIQVVINAVDNLSGALKTIAGTGGTAVAGLNTAIDGIGTHVKSVPNVDIKATCNTSQVNAALDSIKKPSNIAIKGTLDHSNILSGIEGVKTSATSLQGHMSSAFSAIQTSALAFGACLAGGLGMFSLVQNAVDAGNSIYNLTSRMGISAEEAGLLSKAFKAVGADVNEGVGVIARLDKSLLSAGDSGGKMGKTLAEWGVSLKDANGNLLPMNEQLARLSAGYQDAAAKGKEQEYVTEVLGQRGAALIPILKDYSTAMEAASQVKGIMPIDPAKAHEMEVSLMALKMQVSQFGMAVGAALMPIAASIIPPIMAAFQNLAQLIKDHKVEIQGAVQGIADAVSSMGAIVMPIILGIFSFITQHGTASKIIIEGLVGAFLLFQGIGFVVGIIDSIRAAFVAYNVVMGIVKVESALAWLAVMGPTALVVAAIAAVIAIGVALYQNWDTIKAYASTAWDAIKNVVGYALDAITSFIVNWTGPGFIYKHWDDIKASAKIAWDLVCNICSVALDAMVNLLLNWTLPGIIYQHWDDIKSSAQTAWNSITSLLTDVWNNISNIATNVWDGICSFFAENAQAILLAVQTAWDTITSVLTDAWNNISSIATTVWTTILGFFVQNLIDTLDAITTGWNNITQFFTTCWENITTAINTWLNGLINVLNTSWDTITSDVQTKWNTISQFLTGILDGIKSTLSGWVTNVEGTLSDTWNNIYNTTVNIWNTITDWLVNCWNGIYDKAVSIWNNIKSVIAGSSQKTTTDTTNFYANMGSSIIDSMGNLNLNISRISNNMSATQIGNANNVKNLTIAAQDFIANATTEQWATLSAEQKMFCDELTTLNNNYNSGEIAALTATNANMANQTNIFQNNEKNKVIATQVTESNTYRSNQAQQQIDLALHLGTVEKAMESHFKTAISTTQAALNTIHEAEVIAMKDNLSIQSDGYNSEQHSALENQKRLQKIIDDGTKAAKELGDKNANDMANSMVTIFGRINTSASGSFDQLKKIICDPIGSAKDYLKASLDQMAKQILNQVWPTMSPINIPIKEIISGGGGVIGILGGVLSGIGSFFGFAAGGNYPGGLAMVGEKGPELINFNQGGHVSTAADTKSLLAGSGNGGGFVINGLNVYANSEAEGAAAATGFMNKMQQFGYRTRGL